MSPSFQVDLDQLDEVIGAMARCQGRLEGLGTDLDRQVRLLHTEWTGLAAEAQAVAHAEWSRGLLDMRDALGTLREIAAVAHDNYAEAAATNLAMWRTALP